jgi:hypothetical protein
MRTFPTFIPLVQCRRRALDARVQSIGLRRRSKDPAIEID